MDATTDCRAAPVAQQTRQMLDRYPRDLRQGLPAEGPSIRRTPRGIC